MKLTRWMYWTFACSALLALSACASASAPARTATGWTARIAAEVNPHLALLEGQTRGATEAECVPGPVWATSVPFIRYPLWSHARAGQYVVEAAQRNGRAR